jgi:hypothetical protein
VSWTKLLSKADQNVLRCFSVRCSDARYPTHDDCPRCWDRSEAAREEAAYRRVRDLGRGVVDHVRDDGIRVDMQWYCNVVRAELRKNERHVRQ